MARLIHGLLVLGLLASSACGSEVTFFSGQGGSHEGGAGATTSLASVVTATLAASSSSSGGVHAQGCEDLCDARVQMCPSQSLEACLSLCEYRREGAADFGCFAELADYESCWLASPCQQGQQHPAGPDAAEACFESEVAFSACSYAAGCFISGIHLDTSDQQNSCFGETFCDDAYQWTRCEWTEGDAVASCQCFEGLEAVGTCESPVDEIETCRSLNCCL